MYVEFVGNSGAGKTTLAKETVKQLLKEGYNIDIYVKRIISKNEKILFLGKLSRIRKLALYGYSFIKNFLGVFKILKFYLSLRPLSFKPQEWSNLFSFIKMFISISAMTMYSSKTDIFLVDRGYITKMTTTILHKKFQREQALKLLDYLYGKFAHAFIVVDISPETAVQRIKNRLPKGDYKERLPYEAALSECKLFYRKKEKIYFLFIKDRQAPYLYIQGGDSMNENVRKIVSFIKNLKICRKNLTIK